VTMDVLAVRSLRDSPLEDKAVEEVHERILGTS
jgi:hypothetical protein